MTDGQWGPGTTRWRVRAAISQCLRAELVARCVVRPSACPGGTSPVVRSSRGSRAMRAQHGGQGVPWGSDFPRFRPLPTFHPQWSCLGHCFLIFVFYDDSFENLISEGNPGSINYGSDCRPLPAGSTHTSPVMSRRSINTRPTAWRSDLWPQEPARCLLGSSWGSWEFPGMRHIHALELGGGGRVQSLGLRGVSAETRK